jgi:phosphoesterase RecJ-like protein
MFKIAQEQISQASKIVVIQAENPDGDSLGSALALEELLGEQDKEVYLYAPVDIPKYLRYIPGWDRVSQDFPTKADLAIIVDTAADILLSKVLETPGVRNFLETHPVLVIDHHTTESNLSFSHTLISQDVVSATHVVYNLAREADWKINQQSAEHMLAGVLSDTLGLSTQNVSKETFNLVGELVELGAHPSVIDERRREFSKKSQEILAYKGELIGRIEYYLDGQLALVHIPWEDIEQYSDQYNPSVLVLDELRFVENVQLAVAIKTYPDGKLTGKLRGNIPIAEMVAKYFGGGGHPYASGFRVYEEYDTIIKELLTATEKALGEYDATTV